MAGPGRPPLFASAAVRAAVLKAIRDGCPLVHAAAAAGVGRSTLREWKQRGRAGEEPYAGFLGEIQKAEAARVAALTARVVRASGKSWQAAAWYLERTMPERFGSDRRRVRELERRVDDLLKLLGGRPGAQPDSQGAAGGTSDPPAADPAGG